MSIALETRAGNREDPSLTSQSSVLRIEGEDPYILGEDSSSKKLSLCWH